jgi:predicted GNAT family N-acyltransferase
MIHEISKLQSENTKLRRVIEAHKGRGERLENEIMDKTQALKQLISDSVIYLSNPTNKEADTLRSTLWEVREVLEKYEGGKQEC